MVWFCLMLVFSWDDPQVEPVTEFKNTGVFQPLSDWEVLVLPDGRVFISNFQDAQIWPYAADGTQGEAIGRKGRGPGEFTYPWGLWYQGGLLYVYDYLDTNISVFQADDGSFIRKFPSGDRGLSFIRLDDGWLIGDWNRMAPDVTTASVFWANDDVTEKKNLLSITDIGFENGMSVWSDGTETKAVFNPISTRPRLVRVPNQNYAYLADGTQFKLTKIDAHGIGQTIQQPARRIPFDDAWADERLAEQKERNPNLKRIETNTPDYFPAIRSVKVMRDGTIVVDRWRGRPDDKHDPIALDKNGNVVPMPYSWVVVDRMVGETEQQLFIKTYTEAEEEGGVVALRKQDAEAFVKAHPIDPDAETGHSISISN